ncbi:MAG: carbohydrate binding domain-containing protein, partial [Verrucomicrobiae bacterium]|nr:carbohydrate binding domain-containing protein [Verrucomicrobiae bacterium]
MKWQRYLPVFLLWAGDAFGGAPWHHPLYLANGGYWPRRVAVTIQNLADAAVAGEPVPVQAAVLAGAHIESLRVCNAAGQELLFDVRDLRGRVKRKGALAGDDQIVVPAECGAKGAATIYIYAGNDAALVVPDFLKFGFVNGDFESGDDAPDGWKAVETDAKHLATYEKSGGRNSSRCVKVEVAPGAEPTWVKWCQTQIPVTPGRSYRVSGWVRAENVVGRAGWFLHVDGERPMLLAPMLDAGSGTFDWKRVEHTFIVPPTGSNATFGTVLRGTGRAWFDEAEFVALEKGPALRTTVGPLEELKFDAPAPGQPQFSREWPVRATVRVLNLADRRAEGVLVSVDLRRLRARLRGLPANASVRVVEPATGHASSICARLGDSVLFSASVPPRSGREFHLYFSATRGEGDADGAAAYERLVNGPQNLAPNPSFEHGTEPVSYTHL